jgi:hypothetical protein
MSANGCCKVAAAEAGQETTEKRIFGGNPPKLTFVRRFLENAGWIVPCAILAVLPKCPACVATYAVIGTGVGLSLSATTYLRALLVALCVMSLAYLVARRMRRFITTAPATHAKNKYKRTDRGIRSNSWLVYQDLDLVPKACDGAAVDNGMAGAPRSVQQPRNC